MAGWPPPPPLSSFLPLSYASATARRPAPRPVTPVFPPPLVDPAAALTAVDSRSHSVDSCASLADPAASDPILHTPQGDAGAGGADPDQHVGAGGADPRAGGGDQPAGGAAPRVVDADARAGGTDKGTGALTGTDVDLNAGGLAAAVLGT
jgi:hypothetical protein